MDFGAFDAPQEPATATTIRARVAMRMTLELLMRP